MAEISMIIREVFPLFSKSLIRKVTIAFSLTLFCYALLISPIFFIYSNFNKSIKRNISEEYFYGITTTGGGDCYRIAQNFMKDCPFPTREIHLNSEHTIVEIFINEKWYAYDPMFKKFFNNYSVLKISMDVNRGYIPDYMENYEYASSFKEMKFYHSFYFVFLKYICPFYDDIMRVFYMIN
jgi:hypothetical protein